MLQGKVARHQYQAMGYPSCLVYACESGANEFSTQCEKHKLFQLMFGETMHEQIVSRSMDIIKQLYA
jgi:hypothetical protein